MSTGLLLFLVFLALSIIDSVARVRRGQQPKAVLPPEDEGDEEWRQEPSSTQVQRNEAGEEAREKKPRGGADEFLDLEKLMGSGYLERLMGPTVAGVAEDEEGEVPGRAAPARWQVETPEAEAESSRGRDGRRIARQGRSPDQERRRAEARRRRPEADQPEVERRRVRVQERRPEVDRRLPAREDAGSRPARVARETAPLRDSAVDRDRDRLAPVPGRPPGASRLGARRTRLYRELFGAGDRKSLQRAFVLKEILDAPASERQSDRSEAG